MPRQVVAFALAATLGCGASGGAPSHRPGESISGWGRGDAERFQGLTGRLDPTVLGARFVPAGVAGVVAWGTEPGGGVRGIAGGMRLVSYDDGRITTAPDRFAGTPTTMVELPERLGGGFLFGWSKQLWRAQRWLAPATPIYASGPPLGLVQVGLDRVYVRYGDGTLAALDPRTGAALDLGPLRIAPHVQRIAALDGWRALAIADLRGVLFTADAGSSWRALTVPGDVTDVSVEAGAFLVETLEVAATGWPGGVRPRGFLVQASGDVEPAPPRTPSPVREMPAAEPAPAGFHPFGAHPLTTALEDGWPVGDDEALVARDGALGRIRLSNGELLDVVAGAFSMSPSRCHPLALGHADDPRAFGFVCTEARGRTQIEAWQPSRGALVELRTFDDPRVVLACGRGSLVVLGPCTGRAGADSQGSGRRFCLMTPRRGGEPSWSELLIEGEDAARAMPVVLADGRRVAVWPPGRGDLQTARLTFYGSVERPTKPSTVPIRFPALPSEARATLSLGTWMAGFEERRPGVLGGWVEGDGTLVGIEVSVTGQARAGEAILGPGARIASSRWALGWTASRRGFETIDGGMTWSKDIELPDPLPEPRVGRVRACGPIGCIANGWLRVGWGSSPAAAAAASEPPPTRYAAPARPLPARTLACERREEGPAPPGDAAPPERRGPSTGEAVGALDSPPTAFPSSSGRPGPRADSDPIALSTRAALGLDRSLRGVPLARLNAWGPKDDSWAQRGFWQVRWDWPWGGRRDARASAVASAPWTTAEAARRSFGSGLVSAGAWTVAFGDDADHALLMEHRSLAPIVMGVWAAESDQAPVAVSRPGGAPFAEIEAATRVGGRWIIATAQDPSESAATVLWELDGAAAREVRRFPRTLSDGGRRQTRLARRGGRAIGVAVDGQPDLARPPSVWVLGVDLESGVTLDPEPVASLTAWGREAPICTGDDSGWELDVPYPGTLDVQRGDAAPITLQTPIAHILASSDHVCVERFLGTVNPFATDRATDLAVPTGGTPSPARGQDPARRLVDVSVMSATRRFPLRCWAP